MGVFTYSGENASTLAPAKLYKVLIKDSYTLLPKVSPGIQSIEIVEGNGGPGTIHKITYLDEAGKTGHALHKFEAIDEANLEYNYSLVGGDALPSEFEKIVFETKVVGGPNGESISKVTVKYHTKGDAPPSEEEVKTGKARGDGLFRALEAYALANPDYY